MEDNRCPVRVIHLDRIDRARNEAISEREMERLALTYRLMGDPTRLKIILALSSEEMCVCDIAAFLGLTESAVSHHIRRLKDLALIKQRRNGQVLYNSLNDEHVAELLKIGIAHVRE